MNNSKKKLLYVVGGPKAAPRVDVSVLFGKILNRYLFEIDWVIFDPEPGKPAWTITNWCNSKAYVIGRSNGNGLIKSVISKLFEFSADLKTFWLSLTGQYQLIQIRDKFFVALLCLLASKMRGIHYTFWLSYPFPESRLSDALEERAKYKYYSWLVGKLNGLLLYKIIFPYADYCFVQSKQMRQDIYAHGIPFNKMMPVPMGIDDRLLSYPQRRIELNTLVYLGTLIRVRRLEILIEALSQLLKESSQKKIKLVFIGEGDSPSDREYLEKVCKEFGISDAVEFTGQLPMEKALERVSSATICLSPFYPTFVLRSTSPTKLVEYMALGRPVIANDHPEQAEVIAQSGAGICVEWSAKAFADGIKKLLDNPEKAEEMAQKGKKYVERHRTYKSIASQVEETYQKILN